MIVLRAILEKSPEPNKIYILSQLEKHIERENSFMGGKYKNINELITDKKIFRSLSDDKRPPRLKRGSLDRYSKFKVVNRFKVKKKEDIETSAKFKNEQHGWPQKTYHIIIDAKYIKMMVKRSYRAESLYDFFKSLFQFINATLLELESDSKVNCDADFVKKNWIYLLLVPQP